MEPLSQRWKTSVLLADGAMGTLLFARRPNASTCVELSNVDAPDDVERVHADYIAAGAQLIETNTFAANRLKLGQYDLGDQLDAINRAGVAIARRAAQGKAYVAGSVGPLGALMRPLGIVDREEARAIFAEHIEAVAAGSPDVLILETFTSVDEALLALGSAKSVAPSTPILVSLSILEDGNTPGGDPLAPAFARLRAAGADGCGVNCAVGPQAIYDAIAPIVAGLDFPLSIMPNAGYPHRVDDRTVYESAPSYFAHFARAFVELGATIVGGCCGTTPEHIAAMAGEVVGQSVRPRIRRGPAAVSVPGARPSGTASFARPAPATVPAQTAFERRLGKEFVVTVEVSPPRGIDLGASLAAAKLLQSAGVDAIHITDNPTARLRMSGTTVAHLLMRETGIAAILHFSCRDRNLLGLQSELLGAAALGIPAILALTGDPSNVGDFPKATSVFDVTALGLTRILRSLNSGRDHAGNEIGAPTHFRIGAAVNPVPRDLAGEQARFDEKIAAGADFAVTQPVFDTQAMRPFLEHAATAGIPMLVGLLPLRSYANAEYLHNEVPGMHVPEEIRERLRGAADERREGIAIARDLLAQFSSTPGVAGVYVVSQDQYELVAEVVAPSAQAHSAPG